MKAHEYFEELLALYAAGSLSETQQTELKKHLDGCEICQADLVLWNATTNEIFRSNAQIQIPVDLTKKVKQKLRSPGPLISVVRQAWQLLRAQTSLVQSELWPVSALVMGIGILVALISKQTLVIHLISPIVAASALAVVYGPDRDPAIELSRSTPTSAWKILFARLSIVSCYNLVLGLLASFALLFIIPVDMLGSIILGWIAPLVFLSALALLISIWWGTSTAITVSYGLWLAQFLPFHVDGLYINNPHWTTILSVYKDFWHNPFLLFLLALPLLAGALWSANKPENHLKSVNS